MKRRLLTLAAALFVAVRFSAQSAVAPARLAVVAPDPSLAEVEGLLSVDLSKQPGLVLLERAEVEKAYREQALSAMSGSDGVKLGQVLGADGVLLLEPVRASGQQFLAVQLIAVKPGVVLSSERFSWPVQDAAPWSAGLVNHLSPLWPKLTVLVREAVPISIVNLRSSVESQETRELERQLSLLAVDRLSRERELFVLERRHLRVAGAEKELKGLEQAPFWSGSYLLDGTVDRNGYSETTVTIDGGLTPPKGGAPLSFEVSGSRTNLTEVINRLADKVRELLKLGPGSRPWNAGDEAEKYFDEAKWAYRWRLLSEAAADCEDSWALGRQTKDVAELRIRSYYENGVDTAATYYDLAHKLVGFGPGVRPVPGGPPAIHESPFGSSVPPDAARFARVRRAMELYCRDFRTFIASGPEPGWTWHDLGIDLLQGSSYWLRHYYYMPEARRGQEDAIAEMQSLDREIIGLIGRHRAFTNDFDRGQIASTRVNWGYEPALAAYRDRASLLTTEVNWGAYWAATPEQGVQLYRHIILLGVMPRVRELFLTPDFLERSPVASHANGSGLVDTALDLGTLSLGGTLPTPGVLTYLAGWTWPDRKRAPEVWQRFIDDLCASTNTSVQVEGLFLRCAQAPTEPQFDQDFRQFIGFLQKRWNPRFAAREGSGLVADIGRLMTRRWRPGYTAAAADRREQLWSDFKQQIAQRQAIFARRARLQPMTNYLAGESYDFIKFSKLFSNYDYQPDDARLLLPALAAYRARLTARVQALAREQARLTAANNWKALGPVTKQKGRLGSAFFWITRLQQTLENKLNPASSPSSRRAAVPRPGLSRTMPGQLASSSHPSSAFGRPPASPPVAGRPRPPFPAGRPVPPNLLPGPGRSPGHGAAQGTDPASLKLTNVLDVTRFWPLPERLPRAQERSRLFINNCRYREGRLWLDVRALRLGTYLGQETYLNRGALFSVDLDSLRSRAIPLDPASFKLPPARMMFGGQPDAPDCTFEVYRNWIYVSSMNALKRYSLKSRTWETLPVPIRGQARITVVDDRILLSTDDSILEISPDGKEVHILASSRRRPAQTVLDSVPSYGCAPIVGGPGDSLVAFVNGRFYELPRHASDWKLLRPAPELPRASCEVFDRGALFTWRPYGRDEELLGLVSGSSFPDVLLEQEPSHPPGIRYPGGAVSSTTPSPSPRWPLPDGVDVIGYPACLDGDQLWVLADRFDPQGPPGQMSLRYPNGRSAVLFCLRRGEAGPLAIPVKFELPQSPGFARRLSRGPFGPVILAPTPKGLIVATGRIPGFWLIPRNELAARQRTWSRDPDAQDRSSNRH